MNTRVYSISMKRFRHGLWSVVKTLPNVPKMMFDRKANQTKMARFYVTVCYHFVVFQKKSLYFVMLTIFSVTYLKWRMILRLKMICLEAI